MMIKQKIMVILLIVLLVGCQKNGDIEVVSMDEFEGTKESLEETQDRIEKIVPEVQIDEKTEEEIILEEVNQMEKRVDEIMSTLTVEELVGQMFYITLSDYNSTKIPAGGIIFFKEDIKTIEGTVETIEHIQNNAQTPVFIGIDEEGGAVSRITGSESIGGTQIPSAYELAHMKEPTSVYRANLIIANEIKALGFNMNFAPVADINSNSANPIIGDRAFSNTADEVSENVVMAIKAYEEVGIIPIIKHYPGHGDTMADSHYGAVSVTHDIKRLESVELLPFIAGIEAGVKGIMVGHIRVPKVTNNEQPASLSKVLIRELLIEQLNYSGLIITDALNMAAISELYSLEEVITLGLEAGLDIFLMPEDSMQAYEILLEKVNESEVILQRVKSSVRKIIRTKIETGLMDDEVIKPSVTVIGSEAHQEIMDSIKAYD